MVCSVAGITSDANVLTNELRVIGMFISIDTKMRQISLIDFVLQHNDSS